MIAAGIANLLGGDQYGTRLQAPWAIYLWGAYRHPTQIYETLLSVGVLLAWRYMPPASTAPGSRFLQVISLSAGARLFTEAFHAESALAPGGFRLVQVVALALLAAAMYIGRRWASPPSPPRRPPGARFRAAAQTKRIKSKTRIEPGRGGLA
jgi:prolipoprotein diacylglyceryltransferase